MQQPNVVMIVADDMGYGDFGMFNQGPARTPTIDELAREGICLTQHYSGSCVCAPARAALLTGRYPHRTGTIDTLEGLGLDRLGIEEVTIADRLRGAGYRTGLIGKWHLGALDERYHPNARGFDEFVGFRGGWSDYYQWRLDRNGAIEEGDGSYLTDVLAAEASMFIRRNSEMPFFVHVAFNAPHTPLQAPEEFVQRYRESGMEGGVEYIYAMNECMDKGVGQILSTLDEVGCTDNTIVMFTSDNGPQMNVGYSYIDGRNIDTRRFNCGFNGAKGNVYEGGIRVPMILKWPGRLPVNTHSDAFVHYVDWVPTLLDFIGIEYQLDLPLDGTSLATVLSGKLQQEQPVRFWQWNRYSPVMESNAAVRDGRWKLIRPRIDEYMQVKAEHSQMDRDLRYSPELHTAAHIGDEPIRDIPKAAAIELYDLRQDPSETTNLANAHPEKAEELMSKLALWFDEVESERIRKVDFA